MWVVDVILACVLPSLVVPTSATQTSRIQDHKNFHLLPKDCGISFSDRIIGGDVAQLGQYPWLARLGYILPGCTDKTTYRCGGALISSRYVLTAAHCSVDLPEIQCPKTEKEVKFVLTQVVLGEYNVTTNPDCIDGVCAAPIQTINVEKVITHKAYNTPEYANDISLLRLEKEVTLNGWVCPICLPLYKRFKRSYVDHRLEVAGWGVTNMTQKNNSDVVRFVKVPVRKLEKCTDIYEEKLVLGKQMCVGGQKGRDSCTGDSGSPLMTVEPSRTRRPRYFAIGIVSYGVKRCGEADAPAVYTRLSAYGKWMLAKMDI